MEQQIIEGYPQKTYQQPTKRYCQTLDLRNQPELIKEYRRLHSQQNIWNEIISGIKQVGILEMEIYILGTRLFMIVETGINFEWNTAMQKLSTLPRQQEWENLTAKYQMANPNANSAEKWKIMERIFHLYQ